MLRSKSKLAFKKSLLGKNILILILFILLPILGLLFGTGYSQEFRASATDTNTSTLPQNQAHSTTDNSLNSSGSASLSQNIETIGLSNCKYFFFGYRKSILQKIKTFNT